MCDRYSQSVRSSQQPSRGLHMDGLNRQTASEGLPHAMPKPTPTTPEAPASASPARLNPMGCRRMLAAWVRATIDLHNHAAGVFISIPGYRWMPMDAHGYAWVPAHTHTHTHIHTHTQTHTHSHTLPMGARPVGTQPTKNTKRPRYEDARQSHPRDR